MGYIIIQVQVDRVQGCNEDQIALVIPDLSNFVAWIPVILGTTTISHIINVMKEKEIDALTMPWVNARVAHLLSVHRMTAVMVGDEFMVKSSSDDYDKVEFTWNVETIEAFSSHAVQVRAEMAHLGVFKCDHMPFGLFNVLAMFQRLMQNCLGEINLIYCLIYLDDIIMFSWTAE